MTQRGTLVETNDLGVAGLSNGSRAVWFHSLQDFGSE